MYGEKSFYRDYENLLIKNDELSKENRNLKYTQLLLEKQSKPERIKNILLFSLVWIVFLF